MRILTFLCGMILAGGANAADLSVRSTVSDVVMFTSGGMVTRTGALDLSAGNHRLKFTLPEEMDGALDVLLPAGSGISLISQSYQRDRLEPRAVTKSDLFKQKEDQLKQAETALAAFSTRQAAADAAFQSANLRLKLLNSLADGAGNTLETLPEAINLDGLITSFGTQIEKAVADLTTAQNNLTALRYEGEELQRELSDAQQALEAVRPLELGYKELVLQVSAATNYQGPIQLRYVDFGMQWGPSYELDVNQDGKSGSLEITRNANIRQYTGEDWEDVNLTLSTANFSGQSETYLPRSRILRLADKQDNIRVQSMTRSKQMDLSELSSAEVEPLVEMVDSPALSSDINIKGQTIEFAITNPVSIRHGSGDAAVFLIDVKSLETTFFAQATARQDDKAYLYTELENDTGGTLLPGEALIYRDEAPIGTVSFPMITNGDKAELALGPIDGILLEHRILSREDGDKGILTTSNARSERAQTIVTSLLPYDFDLQLFDRIPVSEAEDLVIKETLSPAPSERNIDGRRGVLRWDIDLKAGGTSTVSNGFDMTWPTDKIIR